MAGLELVTRDGGATAVSTETLDGLAGQLRGELITPDHADYDDIRSIWNAMIDKRPGLIVRCAGTADVSAAVSFAREQNLLTAVRSGGHHIAGNSLCDGGVLIDLSQLKAVEVNTGTKTVRVQPGATLGDVDAGTAPHGLVVPVGINSTTGIAGLTLGGGFGWLSRKFGMTVDSLLSAEVVTADGQCITASADSHPDLFWALRGGGGNFGIVTSFEFRGREAGPELFSGLAVFDQKDAPALLRRYRDLAAEMSDDLTVWSVLRKAPPLPFLPEEVHGTDVLVFAFCYAGDPEQGEKVMEPLLSAGEPHGVHCGKMPFAAWQQAFDPLLTPGARNYWKSHNFTELGDATLDVVLKYAASLPSDQCEIFIAQMGGATSRVAADATAYRGRDAAFIMNVHGRWDTAAEDTTCVGWAREFFDAAAKYASPAAYINFMTGEESDRLEAAYGENFARLMGIKQQYDPDNLFRVNQNIAPAS